MRFGPKSEESSKNLDEMKYFPRNLTDNSNIPKYSNGMLCHGRKDW